MQNNDIGTLYVVATPIGNLQDITMRAIEVLKSVDKIAAEDTRHAGPLLKHFSIDKPTFSLHDFNERERLNELLAWLQQGESIALISDAGTPLINDPGYHLVHAAKAAGISVVPVPGACAVIAALSVSGLPTDKFTFEGFLPAKEEARRQTLLALKHEARTMVFYEAPHRLLAALETMRAVFGGEHRVVVARELTKLYESVMNDALDKVIAHYIANPSQQRGEIVLMLQGIDQATSPTCEVTAEHVLDILLEDLPVKQAASLASKITGERKNVLYELALAKKQSRK